MQRRGFIAALGAPIFHPSNGKTRAYRAVAAEQMPAFLECESDAAVVEVRRYNGEAACAAALTELLESHEAHVIARDELVFQLGFGSMEARQLAWASLTGDDQWSQLRARARLVALEVSVYVREM